MTRDDIEARMRIIAEEIAQADGAMAAAEADRKRLDKERRALKAKLAAMDDAAAELAACHADKRQIGLPL